VLEVRNLSVFHHTLQVLWDVHLHVRQGELVSLIGSNGAGKTSMVETIFGLNRQAQGEIHLSGESILGLPPYEIVRKGLSLVPERRELFPRMSVRENLEMGRINNDEDRLEHIYQLFSILEQRTKQLAGTLSGGEQQMLAIARSLMSCPRMLVLDEPSSGLSPLMVAQVFGVLQTLKKEGVTILLLEQNVRRALELADRGYVMENGRIVQEGNARDLLANEHIQTAYLGI
jgi:branched-chain amino acid transport system ATP-binding protein